MKRSQSVFNLDLEGLQQLEKKLNELPVRVRNKALRKSIDDGLEVVFDEVVRRCPRRKSPTMGLYDYIYGMQPEPSLRDNIVKQVSVTKNSAWGRIGINYKVVKHGHLVEFGTKPHDIKLGNRTLHHPGARKQPFMRPAFDATADKAVEIMANELYDAIFGGV